MKLCYVLPQYYKNSSENFFHIANFLSELGKKVELYVVIEHCDIKPKINNVKVLGSKKKILNNNGITEKVKSWESSFFLFY